MDKVKILYAAGNMPGSKIQLARFLQAMKDTPYLVKVAAYKSSSPKNVNINWTLDALLNIFKSDLISKSDVFDNYYQQVKYYNPDLIISDMEYFTSAVANALNIKIWQCSSSLINFATEQKNNLGLFKNYSFLLQKNDFVKSQRIINIIDNADKKLIYSHLGEASSSPSIKKGFEWIRPYYFLGKESIPCRHDLVAGMTKNNKKIISFLKNSQDAVAFTEFPYENYNNVWMKSLSNLEEYFCNIKNCNLFVCDGQTSFLADAFYNNKYSIIMTDLQDLECVANSMYSELYKLGTMIYQSDAKVNNYNDVEIKYDKQIYFLHEKIDLHYR